LNGSRHKLSSNATAATGETSLKHTPYDKQMSTGATASASLAPIDYGSVLCWPSPELSCDIYIGTAEDHEGPLSLPFPGNGGMRIWDYASSEDAITEAIGLANGMGYKHAVYNTGFAGAKVVVNATSGADNKIKINKEALMSKVASVLNSYEGAMYTGCDMNTDLDDMEKLVSETPYVLAGLGNLALDPNDATAFGVLGSLDALTRARFGGLAGTSFVVHGLGNVGSTVAKELVSAGATVYVYDIVPERASAISGAKDLAEVFAAAGSHWAAALPAHDVFVPCSKSNLIGLAAAMDLPAKAICGAANLPFASPEAEEAFFGRGCVFVPESIVSAGAIIADSIEHFDRKAFCEAAPEEIYKFTCEAVFQKTDEALKLTKESGISIRAEVPRLSRSAAAQPPIGRKFKSLEPIAQPLTVDLLQHSIPVDRRTAFEADCSTSEAIGV